MSNPFTRHPAEVGETYPEHLRMASSFGWKLLIAAGASFLHALLPFLCESTGSRLVGELHRTLSERNAGRRPPPGGQARRTPAPAKPSPLRRHREEEARRAMREFI